MKKTRLQIVTIIAICFSAIGGCSQENLKTFARGMEKQFPNNRGPTYVPAYAIQQNRNVPLVQGSRNVISKNRVSGSLISETKTGTTTQCTYNSLGRVFTKTVKSYQRCSLSADW
jgi:hypothetical protein